MSTLKEICKEQTEMIDEMRQNIKELTEENEKLSEQYNKMLEERNSLIDDLSWYKAKVSRLERENHDFKKRNALLMNTVDDLDKENKALRIQSNTYFDEWQESEKQRNEFISYINLYTTLTNHIRMKAEANPGVSRYIDLVNYIDRLERVDDEN